MLTQSFGGLTPDPALARTIDAGMHRGLAESLEHIEERARGSDLDAAGLAGLTRSLRGPDRYGPEAFGWYFDLAFSIFEGRADEARRAIDALTGLRPFSGPRRLSVFGDEALAGRATLYLARIGQADAALFATPGPDLIADFGDRLDGGMALLRRAAPELAEEIDVLIREIVLATGRSGSPMEFDGGSSYQLWGLLLLNPKFHRTPLAMAEVLAHETGHSLLFGHTVDEPLVHNPDDELYPSPLRVDPRPMDGIFHATYVSARMAWTMHRVAADTALDGAVRQEAERAAAADMRNFAAGDSVLREHGQLSDTGSRLIEGARAYVLSAS